MYAILLIIGIVVVTVILYKQNQCSSLSDLLMSFGLSIGINLSFLMLVAFMISLYKLNPL